MDTIVYKAYFKYIITSIDYSKENGKRCNEFLVTNNNCKPTYGL